MKCPCCGEAELIHDTRDTIYSHEGKTIILPEVTGEFCPACGEVIFDREHCERYNRFARKFKLKRRTNIDVDPRYIAEVRKRLALDQRQAAEVFGSGLNAFSRYENGHNKPSVAFIKLLKLLDRHPELLEEVRMA